MGEKMVTVLLSVYNPNVPWLLQLYASLNAQTYPHLQVAIRDDGSTSLAFDELTRLTEALTRPYTLVQNERNVGSTKTFERLTIESGGDFFAYCDQDDIWYPEKIQTLVSGMQTREDATLCYSDMHIIDGTGACIYKSYIDRYKHHVFYEGRGLVPIFLKRNIFPGCTLLIDASVAKKAMPMNQQMYHDHWLALNAANDGAIVWIDKPLLGYRIHGDNQTSFLKEVTSKETYCQSRIVQHIHMLTSISERFAADEVVQAEIAKGIAADHARQAYFHGNVGKIFDIFAYAKQNRAVGLFELVAGICPDFVFRWMLGKLKK